MHVFNLLMFVSIQITRKTFVFTGLLIILIIFICLRIKINISFYYLFESLFQKTDSFFKFYKASFCF